MPSFYLLIYRLIYNLAMINEQVIDVNLESHSKPQNIQPAQKNLYIKDKKKKAFKILNIIFISITIFIFCILTIIASIFAYLIATNNIGRDINNPLIYALYVTVITFTIMDLCLMVIWIGLIITGLIMSIKYHYLTNRKHLFVAINATSLALFFLLNVGVVVLLVLWLGGYYDLLRTRIMLVIGICCIEVIKALIMITVFVVALVVFKRNNKKQQ